MRPGGRRSASLTTKTVIHRATKGEFRKHQRARLATTLAPATNIKRAAGNEWELLPNNSRKHKTTRGTSRLAIGDKSTRSSHTGQITDPINRYCQSILPNSARALKWFAQKSGPAGWSSQWRPNTPEFSKLAHDVNHFTEILPKFSENCLAVHCSYQVIANDGQNAT